MKEETQYDELVTCDHSYDERCHTSFITSYQPHQEQECDERFSKICWISYESQAVNEAVEECVTQQVKDCSEPGPEECTTVFDTVCETHQDAHDVEDDVVNCKTVDKEMCKIVTTGSLEEERCEVWPQEQCEVKKQVVRKFSPRVECEKVGREMCTAGCSIKEAEPVCREKVKAVVVNNPVEECTMEPQKTCKQTTKLLPALEPRQECVQVPKEICSLSKTPRRIKVPFIQKWCYDPEDVAEQAGTDTKPLIAANEYEEDDQGYISSSNYPSNYKKNEDREWFVEVDAGNVIEFEFIEMKIEYHSLCNYDWLEIIDEDGTKILERSCGHQAPETVTSESNKATVKFHSDSSTQKKGFKLRYFAVPSSIREPKGKERINSLYY